jgi:hypothetical protein
MLFRRSTRNLMTLPLSAAAIAVSASSLFAQGRPLFDWSGRVDREVRIMMHGRDARTQTASRSPVTRSRIDVATALPQRDGRVTVRVQDGRGDVDVVQQPSARNDYTTIVRIRDRSSGIDNYRVTAFWMPDNNGNGSWDDRDNYPNRPGRDRDDRDDPGGWGRGNSATAATVVTGMVAGATAGTVTTRLATCCAGPAMSMTQSRSASKAIAWTIAR